MKKLLLSVAAAAVVLPAGAALAADTKDALKTEVNTEAKNAAGVDFSKETNGTVATDLRPEAPAGKPVERQTPAELKQGLATINGAVDATGKVEDKKEEKPAAKPVAKKALPKTSAVK